MEKKAIYNNKGSVIIEFAISIPILILLVLAGIEVGWALNIHYAMVDAARYSVRIAAMQNASASTVIQAAQNELIAMGVNSAANPTITLNPSDPSSVAQGSPVSVSISIPYSNVSILPTPLFLGSATLSVDSSMSKEI